MIDDAVAELALAIQGEDGEPMPGDWLNDLAERIVGDLADEFRGAVAERDALIQAAKGRSCSGGVYCKLCDGPAVASWEDVEHTCPIGGQYDPAAAPRKQQSREETS